MTGGKSSQIGTFSFRRGQQQWGGHITMLRGQGWAGRDYPTTGMGPPVERHVTPRSLSGLAGGEEAVKFTRPPRNATLPLVIARFGHQKSTWQASEDSASGCTTPFPR